MTGANYMGGRRNAVRARSRDKTGRLQRDFFGRRRLNILSKGLGVLPSFGESVLGRQSPLVARASIDFGHAKKAVSTQENKRVASSMSPSVESVSPVSKKRKTDHEANVQVASSTPSSGSKGTKFSSKSSSSTKVTKSKLLQHLDLYEPTSSDAAISCILSMPDLAGLYSSKKPLGKHLDSDPLPQSPISCNLELVSGEEGEEEDNIVDYDSEPQHGSDTISSEDSLASNMASTQSAVAYESSCRLGGVVESHPSETPHIPSNVTQSDMLCYYSPSSNRDWCLLDRSSVSAMKRSKSDRGETSSISSFTSPGSGELSMLPAERPSVNGTGSCSDCLDQNPRQTRESNSGEAVESNLKNLLDYSDPWEQLGVVLGFPEGSRDNKPLWTEQEEAEVPEIPATVGSDLPPSDVPYDDSLDGTYSSLPVAESSDKAKAPSNTTGDCDYIPWDDFGLNFSDIGSGQDLLDVVLFQSPQPSILPLSDYLANDSEAEAIVDMISPSRKDAGTVGKDVRQTARDVASPLVEEVDQTQPLRKPSISRVLVVCGDEGGKTPPQSSPAAGVFSKGCGRPEIKQSPHGVLWSDTSGRPSPEAENIYHDGDICEIKGRYDLTEATRLISCGGVLTPPKLLEHNGVYQGPCLFSEESECSDLEV